MCQSLILPQGHEWKIVAVTMITNVKMAWEASACMMTFLPISLFLLGLNEELDPFIDNLLITIGITHQSHQGPGRLRGQRGP